MKILGISAFYHDSAAALVCDGEIISAAQEERFSRKKHDHRFPTNAAKYCLKEAGITPEDLDAVVFYDKPLIKFERLLETYLSTAPFGIQSFIKAMPLWLKKKLWTPDLIIKGLSYEGPIYFTEHHESHAASAYYPSPFDDAAVLTLDGVGEWATNTFWHGKGTELTCLQEINFPHSIGLLYSAFTYFTGFKVNSGEYKVMGLAPYGTPKYVNIIKENLIDIKDDGSFKLNMDYFAYCSSLRMTNSKFAGLFGGPARKPESELGQREMDLARSVQEVVEEVMIKQARHARKVTGSKNLCLAGGVALNCVGNGKILQEEIFENVWIQPAAGDAGGALGAALALWYRKEKGARPPLVGRDRQKSSYLGPHFSGTEIESCIKKFKAKAQKHERSELLDETSDHLTEGKVIGWYQGRMEFGPRALGHRSIVGDPRSQAMQSTMNLKIKYRESFRPFAPSVLLDHCQKYFDIKSESPYMLLVAPVQEDIRIKMTDEQEALFGIEKLHIARSSIPAVTHVDYSARVQTVSKEDNPLYYDMIDAFREKTGCGLVVNTSFNVRGEPIVCTPEDAYVCFMRTEMDVLVMGSYLFKKEEQPDWKEQDNWREQYELD